MTSAYAGTRALPGASTATSVRATRAKSLARGATRPGPRRRVEPRRAEPSAARRGPPPRARARRRDALEPVRGGARARSPPPRPRAFRRTTPGFPRRCRARPPRPPRPRTLAGRPAADPPPSPPDVPGAHLAHRQARRRVRRRSAALPRARRELPLRVRRGIRRCVTNLAGWRERTNEARPRFKTRPTRPTRASPTPPATDPTPAPPLPPPRARRHRRLRPRSRRAQGARARTGPRGLVARFSNRRFRASRDATDAPVSARAGAEKVVRDGVQKEKTVSFSRGGEGLSPPHPHSAPR